MPTSELCLTDPAARPPVVRVPPSDLLRSTRAIAEVHTNWSTGASAVKVFPASMVGPGYLSALRGPMPDVATMPSGGVRTADIRSWLDAGAIAVSLGGELLGDAFRGGDRGALRERAEQVRAAVDGHRP